MVADSDVVICVVVVEGGVLVVNEVSGDFVVWYDNNFISLVVNNEEDGVGFDVEDSTGLVVEYGSVS